LKIKTILDVINAVDEKFSSEDKWTKGSYAKDANGNKVGELHPNATCWCLDGCIISLTAELPYPSASIANKLGKNTLDYLQKILENNFNSQVYMRHLWNDAPERTFADIKNLLAECKKELVAQ
jgi:hypothetical protein